MKTTFTKILLPTGLLMLSVASLLASPQASAAASSTGRVLFTSVEFVDLDKDDNINPGITWIGEIDGSLDANAHFTNHSPVSDHKSVTTFASNSVNASIESGSSAMSSMTAGSIFFTDIQSQGHTGPGGSYDSIAHFVGLFSLSAMTAVTFSGSVSATAFAGPSSADYANGFAYTLIAALEKPPVDPVVCKVTNDDFCFKGFSITLTNDTVDAVEVGYQLLTSVDGFSAPPVPEPETYAMLLAGLGTLGFTTRRRRQNQNA